MKQFASVFRFEFLNTAKSKTFIITTLLMAVLIIGSLSYPKISAAIRGEDTPSEEQSTFSEKKLALSGLADGEAAAQYYAAALGCEAVSLDSTQEQLTKQVENGEYDYALVFQTPLQYTFITQKISLIDTASMQLDSLVLAKYRMDTLQKLGVSAQDSAAYAAAATQQEVVATGNDTTKSIGYAYALMIMLYMTIMIYGQIVSQSVANEKSSRAMELLITSAKPSSLMFGKVLGVGSAGLLQMLLWLTAAFAGYEINRADWADNAIVQSMFSGSTSLLVYTVVFFLLGYFLYSFLYGALGSLASRLEDVNTLNMPVTLLVVFMYMISLFSMILDFMDSMLIKVLSFIPLTSPMVMFIRILTNEAAPWEIVLSIALLVIGIVGMGYLSAAIYRIGVLLYGKPPKPGELIKLLKNAK